jgi:hypothetical protein
MPHVDNNDIILPCVGNGTAIVAKLAKMLLNFFALSLMSHQKRLECWQPVDIFNLNNVVLVN